MGLSDEERYNNIVEIVNQLKMIETFNNYDLIKFNKPLKNLWYNLLRKTNSSAHWFAGSSSTNSTISGMSLFGSAMIQAKDNFLNSQKTIHDNLNPNIKKFFVYRDNYLPNTSKLLQVEESNVFKIFRLTESYFYYCNRYDDVFSKKLTHLTKFICELQGLCYNTFKHNDIYLKAWMAENILDKIITYNENCIVNSWFMNDNIYHDIKLNNVTTKWLYYIFRTTQFKNLSSEKRLTIILTMCRKNFNYTHNHKSLFELIKKHNIKSSEDKINLELIEKICLGIIKLYERSKEEEAKEYGRYKFCYLTNQVGDNDE